MNGAELCKRLHLNYPQFYALRKLGGAIGRSQKGSGRGVQSFIFDGAEVDEMERRAEIAHGIGTKPPVENADDVGDMEPTPKPPTTTLVHRLELPRKKKMAKDGLPPDRPVRRSLAGSAENREVRGSRRVKGMEQTNLFTGKPETFFGEPEAWERDF